MKQNWLAAAQQLTQQGEAYVLITVMGVSGSTPRNSGTKMLISQDKVFDTIGGGHLEYKVIAHAHKLLLDSSHTNQNSQHIEHFQLAMQLGQCCGGTTSVFFECFAANTTNIMLFGAGHVGQALIQILSSLPVKVTWVDSRKAQFEQCENLTQLTNITAVLSEEPSAEIALMPKNSYYIVMTHNHQLDFELCQNVLKRANFSYLGLIASNTKWRRFQQRFSHKEITAELVNKMHCPIGLSQVSGKKPMEVAVSIAGELINLYQKQKPLEPTHKGVQWRELKQLLGQNVQSTVITSEAK